MGVFSYRAQRCPGRERNPSAIRQAGFELLCFASQGSAHYDQGHCRSGHRPDCKSPSAIARIVIRSALRDHEFRLPRGLAAFSRLMFGLCGLFAHESPAKSLKSCCFTYSASAPTSKWLEPAGSPWRNNPLQSSFVPQQFRGRDVPLVAHLSCMECAWGPDRLRLVIDGEMGFQREKPLATTFPHR